MTLYYEDEFVRLYFGDCREDREWLDADVLVTDPPYGMAYRSNQLRDEVVDMWGRDRPALVFGHWSVPAPVGERQRLIWHKAQTPGMGDLSIPWGPAHEEIHLLGKGWDVAARRPRHARPRVREARPDRPGRKRTGSVITTTTGRGSQYGESSIHGHPTPKPVPLMEALIERCPAGVIADPFAGSGATLIAARNLGRKSIGVELEERYCEQIVRRLAQQAFVFDDWEAAS